MTATPDRHPGRSDTGLVIHWALRYDFMLWARSLGRERAFRSELLDLAGLSAGASVLDVGCGSGTLAIAAARRVGPTGNVHGIDPSPEMIARARRKAQKAAVATDFQTAAAQKLPFPDGRFDVVLSTLVLHQIPHEALSMCASEMRRVLRPGGRLLAVDIDPADPRNPSWTSHTHHGARASFSLSNVVPLLTHVGLKEVDSGRIKFRFVRLERMRYVIAVALE